MLVPIREDFFHNFRGFHGIPSRVHVRFVHDEGKPFVVICSQPLFGVGTSVQNAFQILKGELLPQIGGRARYPYVEPMAQHLGDIKTAIKDTGKLSTGLAVWLIDKFAGKYCRDTYHRYLLRPRANVVWIEHWPPGTDSLVGPPDDYLLVRENENAVPAWIRVDISKLSTELGYTVADIAKPLSTFETDPLASHHKYDA